MQVPQPPGVTVRFPRGLFTKTPAVYHASFDAATSRRDSLR